MAVVKKAVQAGKRAGKRVLETDAAQRAIRASVDALEQIAKDKTDEMGESVKRRAARAGGRSTTGTRRKATSGTSRKSSRKTTGRKKTTAPRGRKKTTARKPASRKKTTARKPASRKKTTTRKPSARKASTSRKKTTTGRKRTSSRKR